MTVNENKHKWRLAGGDQIIFRAAEQIRLRRPLALCSHARLQQYGALLPYISRTESINI